MRYGGNTSCVSVALSDGEHLILDCGSGVRVLGSELAKLRGGKPTRYQVFFSHYHLDHIEGLPYFQPIYDPNSKITFHGFDSEGRTVRQIIETLMAPPYDIHLSCLPLRHPGGSLSYRLEHGGRRIVYATDHEHGDPETDQALLEFTRGADYLIYDATYMEAEYESLRKGWGHSTWYAAVQAARAAEVKCLVLFHHHPEHTDDELDKVLEIARAEFPETKIASEGLELPL
jgi:phosphoribosyl 1,2-cyclic phosphodiesterase